jgi:hypothetical protein
MECLKKLSILNVTLSFRRTEDGVVHLVLWDDDRVSQGKTTDTARNAIDWISRKMDEECDAQHEAFDALMAREVQS